MDALIDTNTFGTTPHMCQYICHQENIKQRKTTIYLKKNWTKKISSNSKTNENWNFQTKKNKDNQQPQLGGWRLKAT
jgi:hypothetical protein